MRNEIIALPQELRSAFENALKRKYLPRHPQRRRMAWQLLAQYVLGLILFGILFVAACIFGWGVISDIEWAPVQGIRNWIRDYMLLVGGVLFLGGWVFVTWFFLAKPLRYLDEIIAAAGRLAEPGEERILLPPAMKSVQDELNLMREQALRNALLAKEAEQRKNDMIVYLAHDLKTPLTSVIGYLTLLADEPQISPEMRARYTGIALDKAERLEELINEFFDIARFNLTTLALERETVNLSRMLEQTVSEFVPILAEKRLTWRTEIEGDVEISGDPDRLERVFDNLIRNAVSYSYPETEIFLSMKRRDGGARICVRNHGKTIPSDRLERIFEQFFRLDASRTSATGGAGLGLAIAKQIVELHGGRIWAESGEERIVFMVELP